jgi:hypothetical protein
MKTDIFLPVTRIVAVLVVPFLWLAFLILFFFPDTTGESFAWAIKPQMTSRYIGAGYMGGSWLFLNVILGKRWHRVQGGFLAITTFTIFMLISTFLHWDRFSHGEPGFYAWLILYIVTPFLVPALWFYNRKTDSGELEESDLRIPSLVLWIPRLFGAAGLIFVLIGFFNPDIVINIWPWALTPLTARIMTGWLSLLCVGAFSMAADPRWSAWRVPLESMIIWHVLVLIAIVISASDFASGLLSGYPLTIFTAVVGVLMYYAYMEIQRRKNPYSG